MLWCDVDNLNFSVIENFVLFFFSSIFCLLFNFSRVFQTSDEEKGNDAT